ncbi:MAG: Glyoxalase/bleomycin resistance protein/dioxygenase [Frankiales bacterium]|nr:Glyoxalase/bleomycin resistance protein/dioxygenase [Frankiales bacterium]
MIMSTRSTPWKPGTPCWVDLMAPDVAAAGRFYSAVLGWEVPQPEEQFGGYVVAHVGGAATAGIGPVREGARSAWTLYFATDDADATLAAVPTHGGTVMSLVQDVMDLGRMALGVDPSGAVFGLWQAGTFLGNQLVGEPGGLAWEDLRSTDPAAATAFYAGLLGVDVTPLAMAGPDYGTFAAPGDPVPYGGMGGMMDCPDGTPSHWLVYFAVASADDAVAAAERAGGRVTSPVKDTAFGRIAGLVDPDGAEFVVHQNTGQPVPQREE